VPVPVHRTGVGAPPHILQDRQAVVALPQMQLAVPLAHPGLQRSSA